MLADGEASQAELAVLRMRLEAIDMGADRLEFEQQLRAACGRVLRSVDVPQGLRQRVHAAVRHRHTGEREGAAWAVSELSAGRSIAGFVIPGAPLGEPAKAATANPHWPKAVAAALLLAGGFLSARLFTDAPDVRKFSQPQVAEIRADIAGFLTQRHEKDSVSADVSNKIQFMQAAVATSRCESILGALPVFPSTADERVTLVGMSETSVPGTGRSVHLRYNVLTAQSREGTPEQVSLFIQQDHEQLPLTTGLTYSVIGGDMVAWTFRDNGLVYYIMSDSKPAVRALILSMGRPEPTQALRQQP